MRLVLLVFLFGFSFLLDVGLTGWTWSTGLCRDAGKSTALFDLWGQNN
jgi:hypothetical protein